MREIVTYNILLRVKNRIVLTGIGSIHGEGSILTRYLILYLVNFILSYFMGASSIGIDATDDSSMKVAVYQSQEVSIPAWVIVIGSAMIIAIGYTIYTYGGVYGVEVSVFETTGGTDSLLPDNSHNPSSSDSGSDPEPDPVQPEPMDQLNIVLSNVLVNAIVSAGKKLDPNEKLHYELLDYIRDDVKTTGRFDDKGIQNYIEGLVPESVDTGKMTENIMDDTLKEISDNRQ